MSERGSAGGGRRAVDDYLETRDHRGWFAGQVPGSVTADLWRAGQVPDPYFERNSLLLEWVPARAWVYRKRITVGEGHRDKRIRLHLKGVDYASSGWKPGEGSASRATPTTIETISALPLARARW